MRDARDALIGDEAECDPFKPRIVNGVLTGGIRFERDRHAVNLSNGERCYTLAQSHQNAKNLTGPTAGAKAVLVRPDIRNDIPECVEKTEHHEIRERLIKVSHALCRPCHWYLTVC